MEKRIGCILILIEDKNSVGRLNAILSKHSEIIIGRQGIPFKDRGINVISLIIEGDVGEIGALCGQIGRLAGVTVKSILAKSNKTENVSGITSI